MNELVSWMFTVGLADTMGVPVDLVTDDTNVHAVVNGHDLLTGSNGVGVICQTCKPGTGSIYASLTGAPSDLEGALEHVGYRGDREALLVLTGLAENNLSAFQILQEEVGE